MCSFCKEIGHTITMCSADGTIEKRKEEAEKRNKKRGENHEQERSGRSVSCEALDLACPPVKPGWIQSEFSLQCATVRGTLLCVVGDSFLCQILMEMEKKHLQKNDESEFHLLTNNPKKKCHHVNLPILFKKGVAGHHSGGDVLMSTYEPV